MLFISENAFFFCYSAGALKVQHTAAHFHSSDDVLVDTADVSFVIIQLVLHVAVAVVRPTLDDRVLETHQHNCVFDNMKPEPRVPHVSCWMIVWW